MQVGTLAAARRYGRLGAALALALAISGCSMGNMFGGNNELAAVRQRQCRSRRDGGGQRPAGDRHRVPARSRSGPAPRRMFFYGNGKVGDPRELHYQAVDRPAVAQLRRLQRPDHREDGRRGRVLLGPTGNEQTIDVPLRFAVERDNVAVFTERYEHPGHDHPAQPVGRFRQGRRERRASPISAARRSSSGSASTRRGLNLCA